VVGSAAIVTSCPDPIIGETLDGIITDWNPAAERLFGYSAAEAIGQPLTILSPPERAHEVEACLVLVRRGEVIAGFETVHRAKDGRLIDVALTIFPVRDEPGAIVGAAATTREVSARKELEQALHTSEQKFRALVEHLPGVVYLLAADEKETPIYYSPYIKKLVGLEPDVALQLTSVPQFSWLEFVHPDDRDWVAALNSSTLESGETFRAEYRTLRADGSYVWVRDESVPIYDDDGEIVAWQGVLLDIGDRIEAEEAQARLAAIVEGAEDAIASLTLDGVITSWNRGAERLFGYRAEETVGKPFTILLAD
jgi:two-component system cell cycle sensor histidine kinase/response regulator CckA